MGYLGIVSFQCGIDAPGLSWPIPLLLWLEVDTGMREVGRDASTLGDGHLLVSLAVLFISVSLRA